jgi:6-phosphogluconolactonase
MSDKPVIEIFPSAGDLANAAAAHFVERSRQSIAARSVFTVALSGGSTPRLLHEHLAQPGYANEVDWRHVELFWGDERCVPPESDQSNFRMAMETLIEHVPLPELNIHRMIGEDDPQEAAAAYEDQLRRVFGGRDARFDLIFLGLGENGHIASLFPHTKLLHETTKEVAAMYVEEVKMSRITFTPKVINAAEEVVFLVSGEGKADVVQRVLEGRRDIEEIPAQLVNPTDGTTRWMLDAAAASKLTNV